MLRFHCAPKSKISRTDTRERLSEKVWGAVRLIYPNAKKQTPTQLHVEKKQMLIKTKWWQRMSILQLFLDLVKT